MTNLLLFLLLLPAPSVTSSSYEMGDREFSRMNYRRAVALYDSALSTSTDSVDVLWRIARAWMCLADTVPSGSKRELYHQAQAFARRSVHADPMSSEAHAWLAAAIGNVAMFEGGATKVKLCRVIKRELDVAIELDSCNDVAYSVLGSFYKALGDVSWVERQLASLFLGGVPDGGYEESDVAFRKAIDLAPEVIRNHFELGKVFMLQDRNPEALTEFRRVLSLPPSVGMDRQMQQEARELAVQIEDSSE